MTTATPKELSIKEMLQTVLDRAAEIKKAAKGGGATHTMAACVLFLALVLDRQEDRLAALEREATRPYGGR